MSGPCAKRARRNGWLIFYTHDVAETPSWIGCSPRLLRDTLQAVAAEGMECLTVRDGLTAIGYASITPQAAMLPATAAAALLVVIVQC